MCPPLRAYAGRMGGGGRASPTHQTPRGGETPPGVFQTCATHEKNPAYALDFKLIELNEFEIFHVYPVSTAQQELEYFSQPSVKTVGNICSRESSESMYQYSMSDGDFNVSLDVLSFSASFTPRAEFFP